MTIKELNKRKVPIVIIDKKLDKYNDVVLFPDKLAKANEMLRKVGLPDIKAKKNGHPVKLRKRVVRHTLHNKNAGRVASKV